VLLLLMVLLLLLLVVVLLVLLLLCWGSKLFEPWELLAAAVGCKAHCRLLIMLCR
jgi:hypothetical protein